MRIIYTSLILLLIAGSAFAYDMPIGIPDPGFGLDSVKPARPNPWSSEQVGYYYVDDTPGCSTTADYGTPDVPRCYIPDPIPEGSVVEVHGEYNHTVGGLILIHSNGTETNPVWVVGESEQVRPLFTKGAVLYGSYLYLEHTNWKFSGGGTIQLGRNRTGFKSDHVMIRNCLIEGDGINMTYAVNAGSFSLDEKTEYLIVVGNIIRNHGKMDATSDQDAHCISINKDTHNTWILDNDISKCSGSGVQVGQDGSGNYVASDIINTYIGRNHIHHNRQAGVGLKSSTSTIVSENIIHDQRTQYKDNGTSFGSASKGVGWKADPKEAWIINNIIYHNSYGIHGGGTYGTDDTIYIIGNEIYDIYPNLPDGYSGLNAWNEAAISAVGANHVYIIGNVVHDVASGIMTPGIGGDPPTKFYYIENNIVSTVRANGIHINSENSADETTLKNNVIYQPGGGEVIRWKSGNYNLSDFQSTVGKGQGCINSDPSFVSASSHDFRLLANSPAVNTALPDTQLTLDIYQKFQDDFGLDIRKDINGTTKPQGTGWDMGSFEYDGVGPLRSDISPTGELPVNTTNTVLSVNTNVDAACKYSTVLGTAYDSMQNTFTTTGGTAHTTTISGLSNGGAYTYFVRCKDTSSDEENISDYGARFTVQPTTACYNTAILCAVEADCVNYGWSWVQGACKDPSSGPSRTNTTAASQPSGTNPTVMTVTTDVAATCRYSLSSGTAYDSMAGTFSTTGGTSHSQDIPTADGQSYTYYVRCTDGTDANDTDLVVSWSVEQAATCDSSHLNLCTDQSSCENASGHWCDGVCQSAACGVTTINCGAFPNVY